MNTFLSNVNGAGMPAGVSRRHWLGRAAGWLGGASLLGLGGCAWLPRTAQVPMPLLRDAAPGRADTLLVMLPGVASRPESFVQEGLVADLRRQGLAADVVMADAHLGYFLDRSVLRRLQADVIAPARARGYRQIWLVGISLGGFGALGYATRHGADIDGVVALAPYLGPDALLREIQRAGGVQAWQAGARPPAGDELEREIWRWLAAPPADAPPVWLGYGREDRLGLGHRLMAAALAPERVLEVAGGHDWAPWRQLWRQWLAQGALPAVPSA